MRIVRNLQTRVSAVDVYVHVHSESALPRDIWCRAHTVPKCRGTDDCRSTPCLHMNPVGNIFEEVPMSDQHDTQSIEDLYPPIMVRPVPFPLPPAFLHQLGYERTVATLESVTADDDRQPRRFVALWWDPAVNQLGWSDGLHRGVGQLDRQVWLAWLHAGGLLGLVGAWLLEHEIHLEDDGLPSLRGTGYWLIVDGAQNCAWAVVHGLGRKVVRRQQFEPTEAELAESDELANDPEFARFYL